MIHIARVEVRAAIEQVLRDLHRARAVERCLPIAAARTDERRIRIHELAQAIEHAKVRRREDVDGRATRNQRSGLLGRDASLEQAKSASPPCALQVEIGPVGEQEIQ